MVQSDFPAHFPPAAEKNALPISSRWSAGSGGRPRCPRGPCLAHGHCGAKGRLGLPGRFAAGDSEEYSGEAWNSERGVDESRGEERRGEERRMVWRMASIRIMMEIRAGLIVI